MSSGQAPDVSGVPDAAALAQSAEMVSGSAGAVVEQLAMLRADLRKEISAAEESAAKDLKQERRDRRRSALKFAIAIGLDVVLSIVGLGLWYSQEQTNHRLQTSLHENYATAQQQAEIRSQVLCPLYEVLMESVIANSGRRAAMPPAQQQLYDHSVQVVRHGYTALGCTPALPAG